MGGMLKLAVPVIDIAKYMPAQAWAWRPQPKELW